MLRFEGAAPAVRADRVESEFQQSGHNRTDGNRRVPGLSGVEE